MLHEAEGFVGDHITLIENDLAVGIYPVIGQIRYTDAFPMVRDLSPSAVDDSCHLVGNNKLQILSCEFITDEEPILDFYGPKDFTAGWKASHLLATAS